MKEIRLYGHLKKYGNSYNLDVKTPAEAVRALCAIIPGFQSHVLKNNEPGYKVFFGGGSVDGENIHFPRSNEVIRIVPVVAGAGKGIGKILFGVALIGLSFVLPTSVALFGKAINLANMAASTGFSLVLGGVAGLLFAPRSDKGPQEKPDARPSFIFDGAVNTVREGAPVPVGYGRLRVGGMIISQGLSVADVPV